MKKIPVLILFGAMTSVLYAQELAVVGIPSVFDHHSYAARMAYLSDPNIGLEINNRFVKEVNVLTLFGAIPLLSGVCSGMYKTYGYRSYREHRFGVGLSKSITPKWALGLQAFPDIKTFGKDYKSLISIDLDATSFAKLNSNLYWDSEIFIPVRVSENTRNDAHLESFIRMSLSYVFSKQCQTAVSIKQQLPYKTEVRLQLSYAPAASLTFFGNAGTTGDCGFGLAYVWNRVTARFQSQYRPVVGYSTTLGLSYQFKSSQKTEPYAV